MRKIVLAAAAVFLAPASANAAGFVNGSFEEGIAPGGFTTVAGGNSTAITGWTVTGNSVDYIGTHWNAQDLNKSVDLNGNGQGGIQQTFDTIAGITYNVSFWLSGNPDGPPVTKTVRVDATGNAFTDYSFNSAAVVRPGSMGWQRYVYSFVASGASTTLSFASRDNTSFGGALDNVSVNAVPEPATWAMMILGFALIGGFMRRGTAAHPGLRIVRT